MNFRTTFLTLMLCAPAHAIEYVYPVAAVHHDGAIKIYVNYQNSNENGSELLLWEWDPVTKVASPAVIPAYTPTDVKIMSSGISFIDKGKIFVKSFNKRSPKSIQFYEPVDDIVSISWNNQDSFYFMGKLGTTYGIFHGTSRGALYPIAHNEISDYLYPQRMGDQLFSIKRTHERYTLVCCQYPQILMPSESRSYQEQVDELLQQTDAEMVPLVPSEQMQELLELPAHAAFLTMLENEGFVISHPIEIENDQTLVSFGYWHLYRTHEGTWEKEQLFDFTLPKSLIVRSQTPEGNGKEKGNDLYESLAPLLPRYVKDTVYFVDASQSRDGSEPVATIYHYDLKTKRRYPIAARPVSTETLSFAPLRVNEFLFYGGRIRSEDLGTGNSKPAAWINKEGLLCLDLPVVVDTTLGEETVQKLLAHV